MAKFICWCLGGDGFYREREIREGVLDLENQFTEAEVDLVYWGGFVVDDQGSVKFDFRSLFNRDRPHLALAKEPVRHKFNLRARVNFKPFKAIREKDYRIVGTKYRLLFSSDQYNEYTDRKVNTKELEFSYNSESGETAFFFNFIVEF